LFGTFHHVVVAAATLTIATVTSDIMMMPKEIEDLLDRTLADSDDPEDVYYAWVVAQYLCRMYSRKDAAIYTDDPMSNHAPSECFDDHMRAWTKLEERLEENFAKAEQDYGEFTNEIYDPNYRPDPKDLLEDLPF
jgi:hypothetical protein